MERVGSNLGMVIVLVAHGIRLIYYSFMITPWQILPIELLQGVTFGFFFPCLVSVSSDISPPGEVHWTMSLKHQASTAQSHFHSSTTITRRFCFRCRNHNDFTCMVDVWWCRWVNGWLDECFNLPFLWRQVHILDLWMDFTSRSCHYYLSATKRFKRSIQFKNICLLNNINKTTLIFNINIYHFIFVNIK